MAVLANTLDLFGRVLKMVRNQVSPIVAAGQPTKLLSLGYIDFVVSQADVARVFGPEVAAVVPVRQDSESIAAWHNGGSSVIDGDALFRALGFEPHYIDIAVIRGGEIVQDLNEPLAPDLVGAFDVVIDSGTLEHCFNIGQAVANVAAALRVGGVVFHGNPMVMINHGFYNFSPAFYYDFYRANGFQMLDILMVEQPRGEVRVTRLDGVKRIKFSDPGEKIIQAIARKIENRPRVWPTQTKYLRNPNLSA